LHGKERKTLWNLSGYRIDQVLNDFLSKLGTHFGICNIIGPLEMIRDMLVFRFVHCSRLLKHAYALVPSG
jgi:hypothetical protein